MSNTTDELLEVTQAPLIPAITELDEQLIVEFLRADPQILTRHPDLLESLRFPHAEKGAISLVELQMQKQRQKIVALEHEITELMSIANHNEKVFRVYADLYPQIIACKQLSELKPLLENTFRTAFGVSALALRFNSELFSPQEPAGTLSPRQMEQIRMHRMNGTQHYFGRLSQHEILQIFGANAQLSSCALIQLGKDQPLALLAIGNLDPNHYTPGTDSLLLTQLCHIIALMLPTLGNS